MRISVQRQTVDRQSSASADATVAAIQRVMAVIEFLPDGTILNANKNFEDAMGYRIDEIRGTHHRQFCDPDYAGSIEYRRFWEQLAAGQYASGEYRRFARGGREIWLQASYNPVKDSSGRVTSVIKFATDITEAKNKASDFESQIGAINRVMAVIEFNPDGTILHANPNFCSAMGYALEEIRGKHHRTFVDPAHGASQEYSAFWESLRAGQAQAAEFRRFAKGGREIWIQASYNPVRNADGKGVKVVKYATDITAMVQRRQRNEAISVDVEKDLGSINNSISSVSRDSTELASATTEATATVQSVAAAAEELNASIQEISGRVRVSQDAAAEASKLTRSADSSTAALIQTSSQMSGIVGLIDDIASQINLLALNATIESARAGEAGRGFAVVASEVKQLASQVTSATKTISTEIRGVQTVADGVAKSLEAITRSVETLSVNVSAVTTSVEQQSSATSEISSTMQSAAAALDQIDKGVNSIANAVAASAKATEQVRVNMTRMTS
jgi:methyl-accepting chemotaxis protein